MEQSSTLQTIQSLQNLLERKSSQSAAANFTASILSTPELTTAKKLLFECRVAVTEMQLRNNYPEIAEPIIELTREAAVAVCLCAGVAYDQIGIACRYAILSYVTSGSNEH